VEEERERGEFSFFLGEEKTEKEKRRKAEKKKRGKEPHRTVVDERQDLLPRERTVLRHARGVGGVEEHVVAQVGARRRDEVAEVLPFLVGAAGGCFFFKRVFF
jgi:hypothetical protein